MPQQDIDLHSAITALSCSLDLVGIDEIRHGKRVAMMAYHIAGALNWPDAEQISLLHAGMLHDCGVAQIREHRQLTETLEWSGADAHAQRGADYLAACPLLAHLALEIRYHHTRWEQLLLLPLDQRTRLRANLLFLADRIDVLQVPYLNSEQILTAAPDIVARLQGLSGSLFAPELLDAFARVAASQAFWLSMDPDYLDEDLRALGKNVAHVALGYSAQRELAHLFSRVVDAKSPYTEQHSERVALIARQLAADFGIGDQELEQVEIAGLLHDIGKLRVSEDIIDKPGKLTAAERASMQRHSYDTYRILSRVFADSKIPVWAGFHHENLRGEGYPFKSAGAAQDLECRIISVADIFQALAQTRPYRASMALEAVLDNLRQRVGAGELDESVVGMLTRQGEAYYRLARGD
ncbi:HD domain-containing protein [Methylomonas sp. SURF-2]|uniref:HD domain-containing protein n=1 Tax=Methylomonas subterranea TaxID=2952225 RepID=A0ABT1THC3_9GAMM|nr:HD domain-containing phosphohydrolase [Methylomonas sp. SURF-2]MCQ8104856.1 HD domain-containing protein [Methylomonas sp. SURF-2]